MDGSVKKWDLQDNSFAGEVGGKERSVFYFAELGNIVALTTKAEEGKWCIEAMDVGAME